MRSFAITLLHIRIPTCSSPFSSKCDRWSSHCVLSAWYGCMENSCPRTATADVTTNTAKNIWRNKGVKKKKEEQLKDCCFFDMATWEKGDWNFCKCEEFILPCIAYCALSVLVNSRVVVTTPLYITCWLCINMLYK